MNTVFGPAWCRNLDPCERLSVKDSAAVLHVLTEPFATVRSTQAAVGDGSAETTHRRLQRLRLRGWVAWEDGQGGTLHTRLRAVEFQERKQ